VKLRLAATIFAFFAMPVFAFGQQGNSSSKAPKPTKADAQKVAQIISSDKAKLQAYCDSKKLYDQMAAAYKKNDTKAADALNKQADALVDKIGPEYSKMMDGLEQVDQKSSEAKEFMAILSGLDKLCAGPAPAQAAQPAPAQPAPAQAPPAQAAPARPALPINLLRVKLRLSNPRPTTLRRPGPVPKSGQPANRPVSFPTEPTWVSGSSWTASGRSWPELHNGSRPPSLCRKSIPSSSWPARIEIQTSAAEQTCNQGGNRIHRTRWRRLTSEACASGHQRVCRTSLTSS